MEDYKLREYFPLKLFEILEEKTQSKELSYNMMLCQSKYFKRLLEQTYNMRKEQAKIKDNDVFMTLKVTPEKIERKMAEIGEYIDLCIKGLIEACTFSQIK